MQPLAPEEQRHLPYACPVRSFAAKEGIASFESIPNFLVGYDSPTVAGQIRDLAAENGFAVRFLILPAKTRDWSKRFIVDTLEDEDVDFRDFDALFVEDRSQAEIDEVLFDHTHLTEEGHRAVGKRLSDEIEKCMQEDGSVSSSGPPGVPSLSVQGQSTRQKQPPL